jgi:hypothetical protein
MLNTVNKTIQGYKALLAALYAKQRTCSGQIFTKTSTNVEAEEDLPQKGLTTIYIKNEVTDIIYCNVCTSEDRMSSSFFIQNLFLYQFHHQSDFHLLLLFPDT